MARAPRTRARRPSAGLSSLVVTLLFGGLLAACAALTWPVVVILSAPPGTLVTSSPGVSETVVTQSVGLVVVAGACLTLGFVLVGAATLRRWVRSA